MKNFPIKTRALALFQSVLLAVSPMLPQVSFSSENVSNSDKIITDANEAQNVYYGENYRQIDSEWQEHHAFGESAFENQAPYKEFSKDFKDA